MGVCFSAGKLNTEVFIPQKTEHFSATNAKRRHKQFSGR
jgi:hypothetical protein